MKFGVRSTDRGASWCLHRICLASKGPAGNHRLSVLLGSNLEPRRRTGQCLSRLRREKKATYPELVTSRRCRLVVVAIETTGRTRRRNFSGSSHWPRHARHQQCWLTLLHSPGCVGGRGCWERHAQSHSLNRWWHSMSPTHVSDKRSNAVSYRALLGSSTECIDTQFILIAQKKKKRICREADPLVGCNMRKCKSSVLIIPHRSFGMRII